MELLVAPALEEIALTRNEESWKLEVLEPPETIQVGARSPEEPRAIAAIYNRLGGLIGKVAGKHDIKSSHVIAIWVAQGGWRPFRPLRAPIRFNIHHFFDAWGSAAAQISTCTSVSVGTIYSLAHPGTIMNIARKDGAPSFPCIITHTPNTRRSCLHGCWLATMLPFGA